PVISEPITISVATGVPAIPIITVNGSQPGSTIVICEGNSVTIESSGEYNLWSTGETTPTISIATGGAYNVVASNGCGTSTSEYVFANVYSAPDNGVAQSGNILLSNETNASYQWLDCGEAGEIPTEITGQNQQGYTATQPGRYAVRVTNAVGCESISECFTVTEADLGTESQDIPKNSILLFPNPASNKITLQTSLQIAQITVVNMLGQIVLKTGNTKEIEVSKLTPGHYILTAQTQSGIWKGKFIKK
ncbi:MAG TPA: T9SS type A sorting domain-containing protein, partial [Flavobacterium sp.]|nr:T9SS type A sorting domain-containing protein [Flavobacterium sp.]